MENKGSLVWSFMAWRFYDGSVWNPTYSIVGLKSFLPYDVKALRLVMRKGGCTECCVVD